MADFLNPINPSLQQANPYNEQFRTPNQQRNQTLTPYAIDPADPQSASRDLNAQFQNPLKQTLEKKQKGARLRTANDISQETSEKREKESIDARRKDRARLFGLEDRTLDTDRIRLEKQNAEILNSIDPTDTREVADRILKNQTTYGAPSLAEADFDSAANNPKGVISKGDLPIPALVGGDTRSPVANDDAIDQKFQSLQPGAQVNTANTKDAGSDPLNADPLDIDSKVVRFENLNSAPKLEDDENTGFMVDSLKKDLPGDKIDLINTQQEQKRNFDDTLDKQVRERSENDETRSDPYQTAIDPDPRKDTAEDFYNISDEKQADDNPIVVADRELQKETEKNRLQEKAENPQPLDDNDLTKNYAADNVPEVKKQQKQQQDDQLGADPLFNTERRLESGRTPSPPETPEEADIVVADRVNEETSGVQRDLEEGNVRNSNPSNLPEERLEPTDVVKENKIAAIRLDYTGDVAAGRIVQNNFDEGISKMDAAKAEAKDAQKEADLDQLGDVSDAKTDIRLEKNANSREESDELTQRNRDLVDQSTDIKRTKTNELIDAAGKTTELRLALDAEENRETDALVKEGLEERKDLHFSLIDRNQQKNAGIEQNISDLAEFNRSEDFEATKRQQRDGQQDFYEIIIELPERRTEQSEAIARDLETTREQFDIDTGQASNRRGITPASALTSEEYEQQFQGSGPAEEENIGKANDADQAYNIDTNRRGNVGTNLGGDAERRGLDQVAGLDR